MNQARSFHRRLLAVFVFQIATQIFYPITGDNSAVGILAYQVVNVLLIASSIRIAANQPRFRLALMLSGGLWLGSSILFALTGSSGGSQWLQIAGYVIIIIFEALLGLLLLNYIFSRMSVTLDVIYAASTVYLTLGALFVPVYGLIETLTFTSLAGAHAFSDGITAIGMAFPWQNFIYYSYVTLTTMGYGDILPITYWARAAATTEATAGVLFTTVIMARLVSLYTSKPSAEG